ncbi:MAG: PAS domain-containing protein [Verrucomicrobiota bacterium]
MPHPADTGAQVGSSHAATLLLAADGQIQGIDDQASALLGYDQREFLGRTLPTLFPQLEGEGHAPTSGGTSPPPSTSFETIAHRKDGSSIQLECTIRPFESASGPQRLFSFRPAKSERSSLDNLDYHFDLLEQAEKIGKIGHWRIDLKNNEVFWSKEIYRIHGVDPETYQPQLAEAINFYHPEDRPSIQEKVHGSIEYGSDFTFEARLLQPDGSERIVRSSGRRATEEDQDADFIIGVFQDITDLRKAQDQLIESDYIKKAHADATNDGLWDWHLQEDYEYMSPRFWSMLGYAPEEKTHSPKEWQTLIFPEDLKLALECYEKHVASRGQHPFHLEARYPHKNGSTIWVICRGEVIEWAEDGTPLRMIGTHTDITSFKETEIELRAAKAELEEFAYRTSHDLRSPLVSSLGLLGLIEDCLENDEMEEALEGVDHIRKSLKKLEALVKDILALTATKTVAIRNEPLNLGSLIDEAIESMAHLKNFDRLRIIRNFSYHGEVFLDRRRLTLILENLISNAIKYQDPEEKDPYICLSIKRVEGQIAIQVEDNGLGIPPEHHPDLFKMFHRFHSQVSFGSGLGLYMVKKSAELLSGTLTFASREQGASFRLTLPMEALPETPKSLFEPLKNQLS